MTNRNKSPYVSYTCVLPPHAELRVPFDPPLNDKLEPVIVGRVGDVIMAERHPNLIVLRNTSDRTSGVQLVVIPAIAGKLARAPWSDILARAEDQFKGLLKDLGLR
jgi:hypothetical protein